MIRTPLLLAFSTASSEAAYPQTLERLEAFGVCTWIASFVLPLGSGLVFVVAVDHLLDMGRTATNAGEPAQA
jgi:Na+/H+-dicarboxylate symporter